MSTYLGDFKEDTIVRFGWNSSTKDGASVTRATNGTISVYKNGGTTQSTAGITDTEDFDALTGVHYCEINTGADAFYVRQADYMVVLSAATIDGQSINSVLAMFSIENRFVAMDSPQKNSILSNIPFYLVSSTDHITPQTGKTVTAQVSKDGGAFAAVTGSVGEVGSGAYAFDASAADMNADFCLFKFTATGVDPTLVGIKTKE